ncbi:MAG TPA: hypothetical protein VF810_00800 [Patescibacteria group bacterium]
MNLLATLLGLKKQTTNLFEPTKGKTLTEYKQELLVKMARKQFEKLQNLGLSIPVSLA